MAGIGLSKPYYAQYSNDGTTVTYSKGGLMGRYTELNISINEASANTLHGDNGPAELDNQFNSGTAAISTDELLAGNMVDVFGAKKVPIDAAGISSADANWYVFDDDQTIPYLGIGGIIKKKINGAIKWMAFVLPKVQFKNPGIVATTQGETISWQTQSLTADILRSDDIKHTWFRISSALESEADAEKAIKAMLNIA